MLFTSVAAILSSALSVAAVQHTVTVGAGGLTYDPPTTVADISDTVVFNFQGSHTVTRSSFDLPCAKLAGNGTFASGVLGSGASFTVTVNDTQPIWIYCGVPGHCEAGMVAAINAPTTGNHTFDAFQSAAKAFVPSSSTSSPASSSSSTTSSTSTTSKGAASLQFSVGSSLLPTVAALGAVGVFVGAML